MIDPRDFGRLEEKVDGLDRRMERLAERVEDVAQAVRARDSKRPGPPKAIVTWVLVTVGTVAAAVGGLLAALT